MKTSDVYLSASLLSLGYKLTNVDRSNPRHMIFEFAAAHENQFGQSLVESLAKENIHTVETSWANKTLQVNAFEFSEALKRLKSIIHSS